MWCRRRRKQISLLVPFQSKDPQRIRSFKWLQAYWRFTLPEAEIIIGKDRKSKKRWYRRRPLPFSKTTAVNNAFRKSHGDIVVILDADAYIHADVIKHCAERIRFARSAGVNLWFIPYHNLLRLTKEATERILDSPVNSPFFLPILSIDVEEINIDSSGYGRRYGALIQIMPREAFEYVGGMDPRFRGWGGDDEAMLLLLDTLWGKHKNTNNDVLHLWHPRIPVDRKDGKGKTYKVRAWEGQKRARLNDELSGRYNQASGDPVAMARLVLDK